MQITLQVESFEDLFKAALEILNIRGPVDEVVAAEMAKTQTKAAPKKEKAAPKKDEGFTDPDPAEPMPFETKAEIDETAVKVLLAEKLKAGKKSEVKELFAKYGVEKLSELIEQHPDKLDEFYAKAGVI